LLPVETTLQVEVEGRSLGTVTQRLFPEYAPRRAEPIEYDDKQLVELLADFTRVIEKIVSPQFWHRNLRVMERTVDLPAKTSAVLK